MNIYEQVFCVNMFLILLGIFPGMVLLDHMVTLFNILMNCQTIVHSGCTILQSQ